MLRYLLWFQFTKRRVAATTTALVDTSAWNQTATHLMKSIFHFYWGKKCQLDNDQMADNDLHLFFWQCAPSKAHSMAYTKVGN